MAGNQKKNNDTWSVVDYVPCKLYDSEPYELYKKEYRGRDIKHIFNR